LTRVLPGVANDSLELDAGGLLPLIGDCVLSIDLEIGRILVAPGFSDPG
jgi:ribosomal 30S subunit maturation factor RimM